MIHQPPIDDLAAKVGSKYSLCIVCAKRARQIQEQAQNQGVTELPGKQKPLSIAAQEIYDGRVIAVKD